MKTRRQRSGTQRSARASAAFGGIFKAEECIRPLFPCGGQEFQDGSWTSSGCFSPREECIWPAGQARNHPGPLLYLYRVHNGPLWLQPAQRDSRH